MDPYDQLEEALQLLSETGMMKSSYAPPLHRLMWRRGVPVRPPHFADFWVNTLNTAVWFGPLWGLVMWVLLWSGQDHSPWLLIAASAMAGVLFGVLMAIFYQESARRNRLPRWDDIPHQTPPPWQQNNNE